MKGRDFHRLGMRLARKHIRREYFFKNSVKPIVSISIFFLLIILFFVAFGLAEADGWYSPLYLCLGLVLGVSGALAFDLFTESVIDNESLNRIQKKNQRKIFSSSWHWILPKRRDEL